VILLRGPRLLLRRYGERLQSAILWCHDPSYSWMIFMTYRDNNHSAIQRRACQVTSAAEFTGKRIARYCRLLFKSRYTRDLSEIVPAHERSATQLSMCAQTVILLILGLILVSSSQIISGTLYTVYGRYDAGSSHYVIIIMDYSYNDSSSMSRPIDFLRYSLYIASYSARLNKSQGMVGMSKSPQHNNQTSYGTKPL